MAFEMTPSRTEIHPCPVCGRRVQAGQQAEERLVSYIGRNPGRRIGRAFNGQEKRALHVSCATQFDADPQRYGGT